METTVHQHGKIKYMAIEFRLEKKIIDKEKFKE